MGHQPSLIECQDFFEPPRVDHLITEDDTPVDNFASEKQQRLLVSALYSSWREQTFLAAANVGVFNIDDNPAIVPDVLLSLNVTVPENWWEKKNRAYMVWRLGKPPDVAIEIVSNREGNELDKKLKIYERVRVSYYIVYDPNQQIGDRVLQAYELRGMRYAEISPEWLEQVGLGVTLWQGEFEGRQDSWLRWCQRDGTLLLTGDERANNAEQRASDAEQRAQKLAEKLRELGINPDSL
ncbi:Uma2 family endonuclease [Geitlerinema splendidum]|nr:Uma2 family endonuclease [Geitlerinema splendidum]